jgi:DNA-binding MarR family transcriptional regulator
MFITDTIADDAQLIAKLGLTPLQAQVYLTLAQMEKATIKSLSSTLKIDRANIYRIMPQLQKLNLVEKMMTTPTFFRALPARDGIPMLLEEKAKEYAETKKQIDALLERQKENQTITANIDCQFALIPDGKLTMRKIDEMVDSTQKTSDLICYWACCEFERTDRICPGAKKLLNNGAYLRHLAYIQSTDELPQKPLRIQKYGNFKLRFTRTPPKATISIYDNKQALLTVFPSLVKGGTPSFWVSNLGVVSILHDYFESMWKEAFDFP